MEKLRERLNFNIRYISFIRLYSCNYVLVHIHTDGLEDTGKVALLIIMFFAQCLQSRSNQIFLTIFTTGLRHYTHIP